jgi:hypothetical protein
MAVGKRRPLKPSAPLHLVCGAGTDNLAGEYEVGGGPPVDPLLPLVNARHLADLLLPDVPDDLALPLHQA